MRQAMPKTNPSARISGAIEVGTDTFDCNDKANRWDGVTFPPIGATIIFRGVDQWEIDTPTFQNVMDANVAACFVSSRFFFDFAGLTNGSQLVWNGVCFWSNDLGRCLETNPDQAPAKTKTPAPQGPGHWEQRPKGQVWVHDAPGGSLAPPVQSHDGVPMPNAQTIKQDLARGWTHYLCPIDEYGKEMYCAGMTQAQTEIAVQAAFATPIGAEDRVAGTIKPIDPLGKYGPRTVNPPPMLPFSSMTVHLAQYEAINQAIAANPQAGAGTPGLAPDATTPQGSASSPQGSASDAAVQAITPHVNLGVRVLEGLAAIAGVFVAVKIWKAAKR